MRPIGQLHDVLCDVGILKRSCKILLVCVGLVFFSNAALAEMSLVLLGNHDQALADWETHSFEGQTKYRLESPDSSGFYFVQATSKASASGLIRELEVDLHETPVLQWRWRVDQALGALPETTKAGDDYAARLYVIVSGGWLFWRTKALNFVWSGRKAKGQQWPNAFAPDNALMHALRGSDDPEGQWFQERVNVRELLSGWFGEDVRYIHAVALMTDTDNSGGTARASYADIYFSPE